MTDAERLRIAIGALRGLADDCPACRGYGDKLGSAYGSSYARRCEQCEPAREALRKLEAA